MNRITKKSSVYLTLILFATTLFGCSSKQTDTTNKATSATANETLNISLDPEQKKEIDLQTDKVKQGFINKVVDAPGRIAPNAELSRLVSTPSAGRVIEVKAKLGDSIQPGQIMAIIKSDAIGQVQSDLLQNALQAKSDIKQQEVQLKLSRITFERESKLFSEQVSAKADLQAAENQLEKDTANLAALKTKLDTIITTAQERLTLLGASRNSAAAVIANKKIDPMVIIRAPEDGVVIERTVNPGEWTDGSKELFTLTDLSQVWLLADVFEKDIHSIKKGQEASVSIDSFPNSAFEARIIWAGDAINATTRTLPVRANVANRNLILKPGMFARIKIDAGKTPVTLVPRLAVIQKGDKTLVFVDKGNNVYEQREVEAGLDDGQNTEIKSGLQLGEQVITHGSTALLGAVMKTAEGKGD